MINVVTKDGGASEPVFPKMNYVKFEIDGSLLFSPFPFPIEFWENGVKLCHSKEMVFYG